MATWRARWHRAQPDFALADFGANRLPAVAAAEHAGNRSTLQAAVHGRIAIRVSRFLRSPRTGAYGGSRRAFA
jgi:hypothetical protein